MIYFLDHIKDCVEVQLRSILHLYIQVLPARRLRKSSLTDHIVRRGESSNVFRAYKQEFCGHRPRGRSPERWSNHIRVDLKVPLLTVERKAKDRVGRKRIVEKKVCEDLSKIVPISQG